MTELSNKSNASVTYKEQQFKERNALLEQKTANLISEAEAVFKVHEALFADISINDVSKNSEKYLEKEISTNQTTNQPTNQSYIQSNTTKNQKPFLNVQKKSAKKLSIRSATNISAIEERAKFADHINHIEINAADDTYTPSNEDVIPIISEIGSGRLYEIWRDMDAEVRLQSINSDSSDMCSYIISYFFTILISFKQTNSSVIDFVVTPGVINSQPMLSTQNKTNEIHFLQDASMRYLKAKLRVMQEEFQKLEVECQEKEKIISQLNIVIKEKEDSENQHIKKNYILQSGIEKSKKLQEELSSKNSDLENQLINFKKDIDSLVREKKNALSTISSLEVRLNRALEEAEKHKNALQKSKENLKVANDTDKKQFEFLKNENIRLEKQKCELITAFKKQLKLIDILKRQKMHIEAAKLLEFTEEEFMRTLDWT